MNKIDIKAVIFDRDGIIVNTEAVSLGATKQVFHELGFEFTEYDHKAIIGRSPRVYVEHFLERWEFDPEYFVKRHKEVFYESFGDVKFFTETIKFIKELHAKSIPIAVTTSAGRDGTLGFLKQAEILDFFEVIVTRENVTKMKPDPEPYILTAKKLGLAPEFCLVIEDTALGVDAAKSAGMHCIAIPNEFTNDQDFSNADAVVGDASEIEEMVRFV